eukprot:1172359-Pleurochrysis_carterae.AAC.1
MLSSLALSCNALPPFSVPWNTRRLPTFAISLGSFSKAVAHARRRDHVQHRRYDGEVIPTAHPFRVLSLSTGGGRATVSAKCTTLHIGMYVSCYEIPSMSYTGSDCFEISRCTHIVWATLFCTNDEA